MSASDRPPGSTVKLPTREERREEHERIAELEARIAWHEQQEKRYEEQTKHLLETSAAQVVECRDTFMEFVRRTIACVEIAILEPERARSMLEHIHEQLSKLYNEDQDLDMPQPRRELLGRVVRDAWIKWARENKKDKPSWLVPWEELDEEYKEADRQIAMAVVRWLINSLNFACEEDPRRGTDPKGWECDGQETQT